MTATFKTTLLLAVGFCCGTLAVLAQAPGEIPGPEKEHAFLHRFVGEWETEAEGSMGPGQPPMQCKGKMKAKMLGEFWLISEAENTMLETKFSAIQTIGYDPLKKKYVGTWVDSMFNHMWRYEGDLNGETLALGAEGPNFLVDGKTAKFQDVYEFKSDDEIAITSRMLGDDGEWVEFMKGTARRIK